MARESGGGPSDELRAAQTTNRADTKVTDSSAARQGRGDWYLPKEIWGLTKVLGAKAAWLYARVRTECVLARKRLGGDNCSLRQEIILRDTPLAKNSFRRALRELTRGVTIDGAEVALVRVTRGKNGGYLRAPGHVEHRFRRKPNTHSDASRTLIPTEAEHRFRAARTP